MFRFSIRDLLWFIAVAAVLMAWWVDRRHLFNDCLSNDALLMRDRGENARVKDENSRLVQILDEQTDIAHAFQSTLDSIHPGWKDADGRISADTWKPFTDEARFPTTRRRH